MKRKSFIVPAISLLTMGSGLLTLYSTFTRAAHHRMDTLRELFPLEFIRLSRSLSLLIGFTLVITSVNLLRHKHRAYLLALALSVAAVVFHLVKGLSYEEALFSAALALILYSSRSVFNVRSGIPELRQELTGLGLALGIAFLYGIAGFWLMDTREFGINFTIVKAIAQTARYLALAGDLRIVPHTRHALWFIDSLYVISFAAIVYSLLALYRPVKYRYIIQPRERQRARAIIERHGRSALDFFKYWPDKSFFFSDTGEAVIAYRAAAGAAVALGDPVGTQPDIEPLIASFATMCRQNDWAAAFHQAGPDFLEIYRRLGFERFKLGDDAIVALDAFSLAGGKGKDFRHRISLLEKAGVTAARFEPPLDDATLSRIQAVSDDWLLLPGHRERQFTLGYFDRAYVRSTAVLAAVDNDGEMQAFVNIIPSYCPGEATIDLMRHCRGAPSGVMDYLLLKLFFDLRNRGYVRFNLGMAPMAGFQPGERTTAPEKTVHGLLQYLNFLFRYRGLKQYKAKFASRWEPRYLIYRNPLGLNRIVRALVQVSEIKDGAPREDIAQADDDQ